MIALLLLLLACHRPTDLDCAVAALDWVGPGGYVQDCVHGRCVVTTAAGCNVELGCVPDLSGGAHIERVPHLPMVCRVGGRP